MRVLDAMAADSVDLLFGGHIRGGHMRRPLPPVMGGFKVLTTNCNLPIWRLRRLTVEDGKPWLHVSARITATYQSPFGAGTIAETSLVNLVSGNSLSSNPQRGSLPLA